MSVRDVPALQRPALASKAVGVLPVPLQTFFVSTWIDPELELFSPPPLLLLW